MPSKLLGMMASAKPSIITGNPNSEIAKIYQESKAGYFFGDNSVNNLIDCIKNLQNNNTLSKELGDNAQKYVSENFSKEIILNNLLTEIEQL